MYIIYESYSFLKKIWSLIIFVCKVKFYHKIPPLYSNRDARSVDVQNYGGPNAFKAPNGNKVTWSRWMVWAWGKWRGMVWVWGKWRGRWDPYHQHSLLPCDCKIISEIAGEKVHTKIMFQTGSSVFDALIEGRNCFYLPVKLHLIHMYDSAKFAFCF